MTNNHDYLVKVIKHFGSQTALAKAIGVSKYLVSTWMLGKSKIQLQYALKIQLLTKGKFKYFKLIDKETRCYLMKK